MAQQKPWERDWNQPAAVPGGVVVKAADPTMPYQAPKAAADLQSTQANANRTQVMTPLDALNARLEAENQRLVNEKLEREMRERSSKEQEMRDRVGRVNSLATQINRVQENYRAGPDQTKGWGGILDFVPTDANKRFDTSGAQLSQMGLAAFRTPNTGTVSDRDAIMFDKANLPTSGTWDSAVEEQLRGLRTRVEEEMRTLGQPAPQWQMYDPAPTNARMAPGGGIEVDIVGGTDPNGYANAQASPPTGPVPGSYEDSYLGQGLSGVNEGIANTLGFPVDAVTTLLNLIPQGINAAANTNLPTITDPVGGSGTFNDLLTGVGSIFPESGGGGQQFARRVGQSVGAAAMPIAGTATSIPRAVAGFASAAGGGVGGATANQLFPGNPYADMAGDLAGSALTGGALLKLAQGQSRRAAEAAVPTTDQLRNQASDLYRQAESRGIVGGPNLTGNLAGRLNQIARDEALVSPTGRVSADYPRAAEAMKLVDDYSGASIDPKQIQVVRDTLADAVGATKGKERRISKMMLSAFDDETAPLAPELAQARKVSSRYLQADDINQAMELSDASAGQFTQAGPENAIRTQFRALDKGITRGTEQFHPDVADAIRTTARGDTTGNALRAVGRLAPRGKLGSFLSTAVPFGMGTAIGGPDIGAYTMLGANGIGEVAARMAEARTMQNASRAELFARNGGAVMGSPILDDFLRRQIAAQAAGQASSFGR